MFPDASVHADNGVICINSSVQNTNKFEKLRFFHNFFCILSLILSLTAIKTLNQ